MGAETKARQKDRLELPERCSCSPDAAAAAAAPGRRLPPLLCFDSIDHVTLSHETRICPLPQAAAQQIAAAGDPSGPSAAHARAPRLPSASGEAGRARALRERATRYSWSDERRLQFRLGAGAERCEVVRARSVEVARVASVL